MDSTTIQMQTGAHCIASIITYVADYLLGPNYNRMVLFGVYLLISSRALIKGDSSRAYALISLSSTLFALIGPSQRCFTNFFGFRLFMKHVFTPALGSIDYRPTDKSTILDIVYGPLPLGGYICTFWLTRAVDLYGGSVVYFLTDPKVLPWVISFFLAGNYFNAPIVITDFMKVFESSAATQLAYVVSRLPDGLAILAAQLTSLFEQADSVWAKKEVAKQNASATLYEYESLTNPRQIRLLKILRRKPGCGLQCELVHVELEDRPSFEAISYTWQGQSSTESIIVDDKRLAVTPGVLEIAKYLGSFYEPRYIWIDGVCINQQNLDEKNVQVPLMKEIYLQSYRVILWLGPQYQVKDAHLARRLLCQLVYGKVEYDADRRKFLEGLRKKRDPGLLAAVKLFSHPWFSRTWVLQEMALARKLAMVYGTICLDWPLVDSGIQIMLDPYTVGFTQMEHRLIGITGMELRERFRNLNTAWFMTVVRQHVQSKQRVSLGLLLGKSITLEATDSKDKVFALLGLITLDLYQNYTPDYKTPIADVYLDVMCRLLGSKDPSDGRTALQFAGIGYARSAALEGQNIPSWVADWSCDAPGRALRLEAGFSIPDDAQEMVYVRSRSYDDKRLLGLQGVVIDIIRSLGSAFDVSSVTGDVDEYTGRLKAWLHEATDMIGKQLGSLEFPSSLERNIEKTLLSFLLSKRSSIEADIGFKPNSIAYWRSLGDGDQITNYLAHLYEGQTKIESLGAAMEFVNSTEIAGKRFCITQKGRLALVPPLAQEGDILCTVVGMELPIAFRRDISENALPTKPFQLVGSCILDNIKDEAIGVEPQWIIVD
ncbi:Heterokaryon incompatibility protein, putative [Glarea lozoyensis ATCC 20868]|uniref:Heterokaryon incompatibility protein, putative n=1 Tax=Glarea lozoyensis (strain ATCC 20868 / MF5171) TaxID=1116229 RepID=S3CZU0_GLAL2|nr:Heterokaryon incompatibility protein, putative [Glarea lozoyensis ATCC 20868]EPE31772.1 Heterokaryon incompatibility protein, putative [Glarea lozoyensis ATCC 20868]